MNPTNSANAHSEAFVDIKHNRNSLEPQPAAPVDERCIHRNVTQTSATNQFSAERGHPVFPIQLPSHTLSLSVGVLYPGTATSNHRHAYESAIYILAGSGYTTIEGQRITWTAGDAVYVPSWAWHQHVATADAEARYLTATNMPLLRKLGQTVLRQEE